MADASTGPQNASNQYLAAAAMFLVELTRADPHWAEWKETDVAAVRCDPQMQLSLLRPPVQLESATEVLQD